MIDLPTLDQFIDGSLDHSYVMESGFRLYLRKGIRYINSKLYENVLQIINCTVRGDESFASLMLKIDLKWSGPILIEFSEYESDQFVSLVRLGFAPAKVEHSDDSCLSYFVKKLPI